MIKTEGEISFVVSLFIFKTPILSQHLLHENTKLI